jgi:hypothetical protein
MTKMQMTIRQFGCFLLNTEISSLTRLLTVCLKKLRNYAFLSCGHESFHTKQLQKGTNVITRSQWIAADNWDHLICTQTRLEK